MMDVIQSGRKTVVESVRVIHHLADDMLNPTARLFEKNECWVVWLTTRTGSLPPESHGIMFLTEAEAQEFANYKNDDGEKDPITEPRRPWAMRRHIEERMDAPDASRFFNRGSTEGYLWFDVPERAGVTVGGKTSRKVLDFLGRQRVGTLKHLHGENWHVAAEFEYCWLNFPHESPVFIAALSQFHYFITRNDFAAGYLLRDLEVMLEGVEAKAERYAMTKKRAGERGGRKSAQARRARVVALMGGLEHVARRNPDIASLGPDVVAAIALKELTEADPKLWAGGKGQVDQYLSEIRCGDAGSDFQARLAALFPSKPLKRFHQQT